jgi:endonuclease YncB( thermonuclease family)
MTRFAILTILLLATSATASAGSADITGIPRIMDGDTVEIDAIKIRLSGIDAPETHQFCVDPAGDRWDCGNTARDELVEHAGGKPWTCHISGTDRYGRSLAACEVDGEDIQSWLVRNGWALSFVRYSHRYDADEVIARDAQAGIWAGAFIAPWDWRHRNVTTTILGATSVPINAQSVLLRPRSRRPH